MHYINGQTRVYTYAMPVMDSRMYILINDQNKKEALIIDPLCSEEAASVIRGLTHATVLLTHSHYDHISGVNRLSELTDCTLLCSRICAGKICDPHKNLAAFATALIIGKTEEEQAQCMEFFELDYSCHADTIFEQETSFDFGSYHVSSQNTPGHSDCSQCIRLTTEKKGLTPDIIFTGDSLVNGHEVITRLPGGSKRDYNKITKPYLASLSDDIVVMPGHGDWAVKSALPLC